MSKKVLVLDSNSVVCNIDNAEKTFQIGEDVFNICLTQSVDGDLTNDGLAVIKNGEALDSIEICSPDNVLITEKSNVITIVLVDGSSTEVYSFDMTKDQKFEELHTELIEF